MYKTKFIGYIVIASILFIATCDKPKSENTSKLSSNKENGTVPEDKAALVTEIKRVINAGGAQDNTANLNYIDTSLITDMSYLFANKRW